MTTKIGISGFGRIGRLVARAAIMDPKLTWLLSTLPRP